MPNVILITGASTGLGEQVATYLAQHGHTVYGTSRTISKLSKPFNTLDMDICDADSVEQAVQHILQKEGHLDVLINNAGLGIASPIESLTLTDVERVFDTNVLGAIRTIQAVLPTMRQQKSGLIINFSSIAAEAGLPYRGAYSATKAALDRITEALRLEIIPFGIRACTIQPGGTRTAINTNRLRATLPNDSVYKKTFDRTYDLIDESVSQGIDPAVFGPLVEKIMQSPTVERVYRIGKPIEKFSVLLKRILPTKLYERMIRNHYDM